MCPSFTREPVGLISTKICADFPTNSGKVLNTSMTLPTRPLTPGYPKLQNLITGEKTLLYKKCPDGWLNLIKFFPGQCRAPVGLHYTLILPGVEVSKSQWHFFPLIRPPMILTNGNDVNGNGNLLGRKLQWSSPTRRSHCWCYSHPWPVSKHFQTCRPLAKQADSGRSPKTKTKKLKYFLKGRVGALESEGLSAFYLETLFPALGGNGLRHLQTGLKPLLKRKKLDSYNCKEKRIF